MDLDDTTLMMVFMFGALLFAAWLRSHEPDDDESGDDEQDGWR